MYRNYHGKWLNFMLKKIVFLAQIIILGFCAFSCSSRKSIIEWRLVKAGSIKLPIDTLTKSIQINHQVYKDTLLIVLNSEQNSLLFYDLKQEKLNKILKFDREGENGINLIEAFLYSHPDSIYLVSSHQYKIYHFNEERKLLRNYNLLKNNKLDSEAALPLNNLQAQAVKIGNYLHLATYPYVNYSQKNAYYTQRIHLILNLENGNINFSSISYPQIYREKPFPTALSYFFRTFNTEEQKFVYSFPASEDLLIEDVKGKKIKSVQASLSRNLMSPPLTLSKFTEDEEEHRRIYAKSNQYLMIYYEPFKKIYIRIAIKNTDNEFFTYVIILDEKFDKILEQELIKTDKTFKAVNALFPFVTSKGLYFPNPRSQSEDFFEMDVYQLVKKE